MKETIALMLASTGPGHVREDGGGRVATDASAPMYAPVGAAAVQWAAEAG